MGGFVVGKIILPYDPKWLFNNRRHKKRAKYVKIASKEGKKKALDVLEKDYKDGMIDYHTYREIRNFLLYKVKEVEFSEGEYIRRLLNILEFISSSKKTKISDISLGVKMNSEEVLKVLKWAEKRFPNLVKAVYLYVKRGAT